MEYTEAKQIDRVEVVDLWVVQVREATIVLKGGEQIAKKYHRWSFVPGSDMSDMPENVKAIAQAAWTPEVIQKYKAFLAQQEALVAAHQGVQP